MRLKLLLPLLFIAAVFFRMEAPADVYLTKSGSVSFLSEAPLEVIEASNDMVGAVLNRTTRTLAFQVPIVGFNGFNSALQHEHFNENYLETDAFPKATFNGKIIEDVDLENPGTHKVRAKGMLVIHGVEKERIILGTIVVTGSGINIKTSFEVTLQDHDISIPRIVTQKITEVVTVELSASLNPKS